MINRSSISDENIASKLRCVISIKYIVDFEGLVKNNVKYHLNNFDND